MVAFQIQFEGSMAEPLVLAPRLDAFAAPKLAAALSAIAPDSTVQVDGSAVTHFSALCVQVLISAARTFSDAGGQLELINLGERATEQLAVMGLSPTQLTEGAT